METLRDPHRPISHQNIDRLAWISFQDEAEKVQHESALEALNQQFPDQEDLVGRMYRQKLQEFMPEASIRSYVSIFVTREIKGTLQRLTRGTH